MAMQTFNKGDYRYGFNGKEKDDEWHGSGNSYDYGFRIYDPRLAKFLSVDPLIKGYPFYTPYQFASNNPVVAIDLDGLEAVVVITAITDEKGEASSHRGEYFMYQVKIYENMTIEEYQAAYQAGTLKEPTATTTASRDAWGKSSSRGKKRYGTHNETPPGTYWMTYSKTGYGSKKYNIKISDTKDEDYIDGPDGKREGVRWHQYSPHDAIGCITTGDLSKKSVKKLVKKIPSLEDGKDVRLIIEPREVEWNEETKRYEGVVTKEKAQVNGSLKTAIGHLDKMKHYTESMQRNARLLKFYRKEGNKKMIDVMKSINGRDLARYKTEKKAFKAELKKIKKGG